MSVPLVGLFPDLTHAESVVDDLLAAGVDRSAISVMANDASGDYAARSVVAVSGQPAATAAGAGAAIGGAAGLLLGMAALAIPGVGPVIAAGPLLAALSGSLLGAATGGLVGALVQIGIPEEEAHLYAEGLRRGGTVVSVEVGSSLRQRAADIMRMRGAQDIHESAALWTREGAAGVRRVA